MGFLPDVFPVGKEVDKTGGDVAAIFGSGVATKDPAAIAGNAR